VNDPSAKTSRAKLRDLVMQVQSDKTDPFKDPFADDDRAKNADLQIPSPARTENDLPPPDEPAPLRNNIDPFPEENVPSAPPGEELMPERPLPDGVLAPTEGVDCDANAADCNRLIQDLRSRDISKILVALAIDGVSHSYGPRRALADVSLSIPPATFVVLLGLNGAGKSTLFSLITRLFATQHGQISVFGHDIARAPGAALRRLGVVFQLRTLDLDLSVTQNLQYHAALHGIDRREARARAGELLGRIGLTDRSGSKVRDLSGGQMRRLEIARALLHRPRLLLLDEATVGLDVKARADILGHVRRLVSEQGIGVLWATHLFDEIVPGDDLVVLHQGRILARGLVERVVAEARADNLHSAFMQLTGTGAKTGSFAS